MKKVILLATIVLNLFIFNAKAGDTDFRTWTNWNVSYNVNDKLDVKGGLEYRTKHNASATDVWALKVETNYKLLPFLKAGVGYEFHMKHRTDHWQKRHRYSLSLNESWTVGRFDLSLRERFQHTISDHNEFRLRTRAQAKYKVNDWLKPYASIEMYNNLHHGDNFKITRMRYRAGMELKIAKNVTTDLYYLYQKQPDKAYNITGIDINFKF